MSFPTSLLSRSSAVDAGPARFSSQFSRHQECRRCSQQSASTSYSDSQGLLFPSRQHARPCDTQVRSAAASKKVGPSPERKATDSLREQLKDSGPVKNLGCGLSGFLAYAMSVLLLYSLLACADSRMTLKPITSSRKKSGKERGPLCSCLQKSKAVTSM